MSTDAPPSHATIIGALGIESLSPLLTLLDALMGHKSPLAPLPAPRTAAAGTDADKAPSASADGADAHAVESEDGAAAVDASLPLESAVAEFDLAAANPLFARFLRAAYDAITGTLGSLGLALAARIPSADGSDSIHATEGGGVATALVLCPAAGGGDVLRRGDVRALCSLVEARLAEPAVVLDHLEGVARTTMRGCVELIAASSAAKSGSLDTEAVSKMEVKPGTVFGEEWSVGMETAWEANGAYGILTMPNYKAWTEAHARHRARSWRSSLREDATFPYGRLWRFERYECSRTPTHEVIHLLQHVAGQRMNHQLAEHDGAFATYVLMMAVALAERTAATGSSGTGAGAAAASVGADAARTRAGTGPVAVTGAGDPSSGADTSDRGARVYYPGAVEEALLESLDYVRIFHRLDTEEARERWDATSMAEYAKWRDSFGARDMSDTRWGDRGNFGGEMPRENLCKNFVAVEAVCPDGRILEDEDIPGTVQDMLDTMFVGRTGDVDGVEVDIRPRVKLSGMSVSERLDKVLAPCGEAAVALLAELGVRPLAV